MAPIAGTWHFLTDEAAFFAPTMALGPEMPPAALEPQTPQPALGPKVPGTLFGLDVSSVPRTMTIEAIARGTVFLLNFMDFSDATSVSDGCFRQPFHNDVAAFVVSTLFLLGAFECFSGAFPIASAFLFIEASVEASEPGTG
jgi:hypothetical protein